MITNKYRTLIERFPLVPIRSDSQLGQAHEVAQSLMFNPALAADEQDYLDADHALKQVDLQKILGVSSSGVMSEIVSGKRELTKEHCVRLGDHFSVSPALFLPKVLA